MAFEPVDKEQLWEWSKFINSNELARYTLSDTTQHNEVVTATQTGVMVIKLTANAQNTVAFIRVATASCGFSNTYTMPAYFSEVIISIPVEKGNRVGILYKKTSGNDTANIIVEQRY